MALDQKSAGVVDFEVRAYIYSLVSALGGTGTAEDGRYVLGDDALACLKDLKRWIKLYDERLNRLDVARCLAEANLVEGDLLQILSLWISAGVENKSLSKIALASLELLVPLTWPIDKDDEQMTVNHHRHLPYLKVAQCNYKRAILHHEQTQILRTIVAIALPSIALPPDERSNRDDGIIRLMLYFLRNVMMITLPGGAAKADEDNEDEVSRSTTIDAFHAQDIFHLLLTIAAGVGEEFNSQDVIILEVLFHLLRGIDAEKLFMNDTEVEVSKDEELRNLLHREAGMRRDYARNAPTRHNRFGTMIWIKRDDNRFSAVSGQDSLVDGQKSLAKLDKTKKWKQPRKKAPQIEAQEQETDLPVPLTSSATGHLRKFVEDFLDSAFNPLFIHVRKAIEREASRVVDSHHRQYFFLVAWFLRAARARHHAAKKAQEAASGSGDQENDTFALIAGALTQEGFIALNRLMEQSLDAKAWQNLKAGMRCFTQILLTVQEMSESPLEEDQTIAENMLNRLFYEESTHDRMVKIMRSYTNQGFGYLDACTELAHFYIRMLEHYSKQNVEMQVRSRRRARKKRRQQQRQEDASAGIQSAHEPDEEQEAEAEDVADVQRISTERKFDFDKFVVKFMNQACVDTFVALARCYAELKPEQLKRAHRFFYRVAFRMDRSVLLFRVDIIALLHKMVRGPDGMVRNSAAFKEWEELARQVFKKLTRKLSERPVLAIEMLFSKVNATMYYLEHGCERQLATKTPRAPAELEVKPGFSQREQIGIAVNVLLNQNKGDAIAWVKATLDAAKSERQSWEGAQQATAALEPAADSTAEGDTVQEATASQAPSIMVRPDNESHRVAMFKDNKLRLLMTLVGLQKLGVDEGLDSTWIVPSSLSSSDLEQSLDAIKSAEFSPPTFDDGQTAEDLIRRKSAARRKAAFDDDSDGVDDDEVLFPAGGPTIRKSEALEELKSRRKRKRDVEAVDEATREARAEARRRADLEKQRRIKSDLFIHDSDDEDDEERDKEFFEAEARRRSKTSNLLSEMIKKATEDDSRKRKSGAKEGGGRKARRVGRGSDDESEDESMASAGSSSRDQGSPLSMSEGDDDLEDTPPSSPRQTSSQAKTPTGLGARSRSLSISTPVASPASKYMRAEILSSRLNKEGDGVDEDEEAEVVMAAGSRRGRRGLIVESDSE